MGCLSAELNSDDRRVSFQAPRSHQLSTEAVCHPLSKGKQRQHPPAIQGWCIQRPWERWESYCLYGWNPVREVGVRRVKNGRWTGRHVTGQQGDRRCCAKRRAQTRDWDLTNDGDAALGPFSRVTRAAEQGVFLTPPQALGMRSRVCLWGLHGFLVGWVLWVLSVWFGFVSAEG